MSKKLECNVCGDRFDAEAGYKLDLEATYTGRSLVFLDQLCIQCACDLNTEIRVAMKRIQIIRDLDTP
jgi:hypothetical protein